MYNKNMEISQLRDQMSLCDAILKDDPQNTTFLAIKGACFVKQGKFQEAIEAYNKVLEIKPGDIYALVSKAVCLRALGKYQESIEMCDRALGINPNHSAALENRSRAIHALQKLQEESKIDVPYPIDTYSLIRKGNDLTRGGKFQEAIEIFDKVLEERDTNYSYALSHKGTSLSKLGRYQEAIEIFDNLHTLVDKGVALAMWGKYQESVEVFDQALKSNQNDTNVLSDRNAVLRALKRQKEGEGNIKFYQGRVSYKPEPGEDRIEFIDLLASLFGDRMLLDESEEKLRAKFQDTIDRWNEFTPEERGQQYKILQSLKKEKTRVLQSKARIITVQQNSNDLLTIIKVVLIIFAILIFIVGLATVVSWNHGGEHITPASATQDCLNWGGQPIYDNQGQYSDCAIDGRIQ